MGNRLCVAYLGKSRISIAKFVKMLKVWNNRGRQIWNFPNCAGVIDGEHIVIQATNNAALSL